MRSGEIWGIKGRNVLVEIGGTFDKIRNDDCVQHCEIDNQTSTERESAKDSYEEVQVNDPDSSTNSICSLDIRQTTKSGMIEETLYEVIVPDEVE